MGGHDREGPGSVLELARERRRHRGRRGGKLVELLAFDLELGEELEAGDWEYLLELRDAAMAKGRPDLVPAELVKREELAKRIPSGPWELWHELHKTRPIGLGSAGGISCLEFEARCRRRRMTEQAQDEWWELISAMEEEFQRFQASRGASKREGK